MTTPRPTGTVTFLFTDIEGSTGRWEAQTAEMRAALTAHDATLRTAIETHGGWLFKHTGDGIVAAFSSPAGAVAAVVEAQRALQLPVRMGIATGEAELRGDDYFGPTLNRASRVMAAGHGGQVLVANSTAALLDGTDLLDLGEHRLRDLSGAQRIFQVRAEGLRESFPPLRALTTVPGNLPAQLTSFVGREEDLGKLVEALGKHRLVTLTGVGGVGKTRLALHAAAELAPDYRGGAWVVELAPVSDPAAVGHAIAATLGITQQPERTIGESVVEALAFRDLLLVLDNCEHLIDEVANLAGEIVARCPGVRLLATSREALMIDGEQTWPVPSLSFRDGAVSPAVTLFAERAEAVAPSFDLAADAEAVGEICRRLDGIPLAIELAAARVRSMSPGQIRDHLDERFRLLTGGSRRALERHQTLRHAVQWSYDLLNEAEKQLLSRLSVFAGGFSLEAAEQVGGEDADVMDLLDSLVRKSLVTTERAGNEVRYGLLETIRQFGEEQLGESGEAEAVRARHARYFATAAVANYEVLVSPRQREALEWFEMELANLRTAFRWSLDGGDVATAARVAVEAGLFGWLRLNFEPVLWAIDALNAARATRTPDLLTVAAYCQFIGRLDESCRFAEEAIQLVVQGGQAVRSTKPWWLLALAHFHSGNVEGGIQVLRSGAARHEEQPWLWCSCLQVMFLAVDGRDEEAIYLADKVLPLARASGVPSVEACALQYSARAYGTCDVTVAIEMLEEATKIDQTHGLTIMEVTALRELAVWLGRAGEVRRALAIVLGSLKSLEAAGDWIISRYTLAQLLLLLEQVRCYESAAVLSAEVEGAMSAATDRARMDAALAHSREALGEVEFERLAAKGAAMPFPELVHYAEEQIRLALAELGDEAENAGKEVLP
jgi:predicted ATPase/class 3 adenylate cyclase